VEVAAVAADREKEENRTQGRRKMRAVHRSARRATVAVPETCIGSSIWETKERGK
jgi:hypothetical protein